MPEFDPSTLTATVEQTIFEVTDSNGRKLSLKKPNVLAQFRMIEAIGEAANNEVYTSMVMPLIYLHKIGDEIVHPPHTKRQVEHTLQTLDHEGMIAIMAGIREHFGKSQEEEKVVAKK